MVQSALNSGGTRTATMAQRGNTYTALSAKKYTTTPWIIDSEASDHITGDITAFSDYRTCNKSTSV